VWRKESSEKRFSTKRISRVLITCVLIILHYMCVLITLGSGVRILITLSGAKCVLNLLGIWKSIETK